jgi:hypothetical protein
MLVKAAARRVYLRWNMGQERSSGLVGWLGANSPYGVVASLLVHYIMGDYLLM